MYTQSIDKIHVRQSIYEKDTRYRQFIDELHAKWFTLKHTIDGQHMKHKLDGLLSTIRLCIQHQRLGYLPIFRKFILYFFYII